MSNTGNQDLPSTTPSSPSSVSPAPSGAETGTETGAEADATLDLSYILGVLLRGRWIILGTCVLIVGAAAGYTYTVTPVYESASVVRIGQQGGNAPAGIVKEGGAADEPPDLTSEMGVLRNSQELSRRVVDRLRDTVAVRGKSVVPALFDNKSGDPLPDVKAAHRVGQQVSFSPRPDRKMIKITVESSHPKEVSLIANAYAEEYKVLSRERSRASVRAARTFLEKQEKKTRQKIRRLESRWESFARENRIVGEGAGGGRISERYDELKSRHDELKFELEREQTQIDLLRRRLRKIQPQLEETMLKKQEESNLKSRIEVLDQEIADNRAEMAQFYARHPGLEEDTTRLRKQFPEMAKFRRKTKALEKKRQTLVKQIVDETTGDTAKAHRDEDPIGRVENLRRQIAEKELKVDNLEAQIKSISDEVKNYEEKVKKIPQNRIKRDRLERKLSQAESFHAQIVDELQQVTLKEEAQLGYVEIVRSAFVPGAPIRPKTTQNLILGVLLGIGLGVGVVFLREALNDQVRRPEDIEAKGYRLLGVVPEMDNEIERMFDGNDTTVVEGHQLSTCLMPLLNPWSSVTENYRLIQINLAASGRDPSNTFLVTSPGQGEGKTVTATNLALTGALSGQNVLLIDADIRKPSAHDVLGMSRTPGVADLLENMPPSNGRKRIPGRQPAEQEAGKKGDVKTSYWTNETPVDGLRFIPAGIPESSPTKAFDSERFRRLVTAAQHHFDLVIVDSPPTQATSDAVVIGTKTEAQTIVVSADGSDTRSLDTAIESLQKAGAEVAGVILNRFDEQKQGRFEEYAYYGDEKHPTY